MEEKLNKIIELLEKIEENTRPVVSIPTIWTWPPCDTDSGTWSPDQVCTDEQPKIVWTCKDNTGCSCRVCNPSGHCNKGCVQCGCQNIAIYDEHGQWWCNNCWRAKDGSPSA